MLVRFGDFAIDWNLVYAATINTTLEVDIYADWPITTEMSIMGIIKRDDANAAWKLACTDKRFAVFNNLAIDISLVRFVFDESASKGGYALLVLPSGNFAKLPIESETVAAILRHIGNGLEGGERVEPIDE